MKVFLLVLLVDLASSHILGEDEPNTKDPDAMCKEIMFVSGHFIRTGEDACGDLEEELEFLANQLFSDNYRTTFLTLMNGVVPEVTVPGTLDAVREHGEKEPMLPVVTSCRKLMCFYAIVAVRVANSNTFPSCCGEEKTYRQLARQRDQLSEQLLAGTIRYVNPTHMALFLCTHVTGIVEYHRREAVFQAKLKEQLANRKYLKDAPPKQGEEATPKDGQSEL